MTTLLQSTAPNVPCRRGKVRDVYDLGNRLVIVTTDRISAFDRVFPTGIPDKGKVLTALSVFWFEILGIPHHLLSLDIDHMPWAFGPYKNELQGRTMLVRKTDVVPFECVVRGYLAGSGWKDYCRGGAVCGVTLPKGLCESEQLEEPIFTPATKAETGHDENITFEHMAESVGLDLALQLRGMSLDAYQRAAAYARERGIIIADTKFEWGALSDGRIILIDEVLTPDNSRFWPTDQYQPGRSQPSFDKQFIRDWAESTGWDKNSDPPEIPAEVVAQTREKYLEAYERLTGRALQC